MKNYTLEISSQELTQVIQAYNTIRIFLEKLISPNELYRDAFLKGLQTAQKETAEGKIEEVKTFDDFIR